MRGGESEKMEGTFSGSRTVVIQFPTFAVAKAWYTGVEYSEILPLRQAVEIGALMLVEGV